MASLQNANHHVASSSSASAFVLLILLLLLPLHLLLLWLGSEKIGTLNESVYLLALLSRLLGLFGDYNFMLIIFL